MGIMNPEQNVSVDHVKIFSKYQEFIQLLKCDGESMVYVY